MLPRQHSRDRGEWWYRRVARAIDVNTQWSMSGRAHYVDIRMASHDYPGVSNCSTICSDKQQGNIKAPFYFPFVRGIRRWPVETCLVSDEVCPNTSSLSYQHWGNLMLMPLRHRDDWGISCQYDVYELFRGKYQNTCFVPVILMNVYFQFYHNTHTHITITRNHSDIKITCY